MAHVPIDDARELFYDTNPKSWSQLEHVLQQHKGKVDGISDTLIDLMIPLVRKEKHSGEPFPSTPEQLQDWFNQQFAATGRGGKP
ncbi:MAG TPA: hypothetical protein VKX96_05840 [Chloroflexota bacterium]|nr:hypothetical protein [Chloroflexota bacterium]